MRIVGLVLFMAFFGCGTKEVIKEKLVPGGEPKQPGPTPQPPAGGTPTFSTLSGLLQSNCALSGCHAGASFLQSEAGFLNSRSKIRIGNGTMPPQYSPKYSQWTQREKDLMSAYFDSKQ